MKNKVQYLVTLIFLIMFSAGPCLGEVAKNTEGSEQGRGTPIGEVQSTIDGVVRIVESLPGEDNLRQRRDQLHDLIRPRFDFREMSKRSLGTHWNECTPEEQEQFADLFSDLLAKTYLARIEHARSNMIKIKNESVTDNKAIVRTSVDYKGDVFPIDYKLVLRDGQWRVYDVVIENIGLVANYRSEFDGIIRKEKFSGLMEKLREKTKKS